MQRVGIREFKNKATTLLASDETLVIERHGQPIGFYIPLVAKDRAAGQASLDRLSETVAAILARTGMTEDELVYALTHDDHTH